MKEKVNVTGVPETMIQTLYARAKESGKKDAKIKDDMAMEIVSKPIRIRQWHMALLPERLYWIIW